ncbi:hypothetical protein RF55_12615 [Lasius niger]|uniref:SAM domain-containing protein n=1 Tax=Lasius niger TaxID=67767 RepID=A0A0J7KCL1_LASNI|nr:hypothetical protein RF55_12615 [Lasius niger]
MSADKLLTAWGFNEEIIGRFIAEEIEADQFSNLTEEDLKVLIPNIGPRRKFQCDVKKYLDKIAYQPIENVDPNNQQAKQQDLNNTNIPIERQKRDEDNNELNKDNNIISFTENSCPTSSSTSISTSTGYDVIVLTNNATEVNSATEIQQYAADDKYDLQSILKKSEDGQLLLSLYKTEGKLNNDLRNKLAKIIVSNELSPNINNTIRSERASFLSEQVIQLFPTEDKSVWYIKNKKGESQDEESDDDNVTKNYEEYMLWLTNNRLPWQTVIEYWCLTAKKKIKRSSNK